LLYIGIMSGTSLDGIDVALMAIDGNAPHTEPLPVERMASCCVPFPTDLVGLLQQLSQPGHNEIDLMAVADSALAHCYADAVEQLLQQVLTQRHAQGEPALTLQQLKASIRAIGCHGQTIRHRPNFAQRFTLQIGDMHRLAVLTGIRVIADFRRKDIAYGGQGAPLVPVFHQRIFADAHQARAVVNIGGIANISVLDPKAAAPLGFDTGPGNALMDNFIQRHQGKSYDADGAWAASGNLKPALLQLLLDDAYFRQAPPKSTGREYFNLAWLDAKLAAFDALPSVAACIPADIQRTLCRFTAHTIADALAPFASRTLYVCGGGVYNKVLMRDLTELMAVQQCTVTSTATLGVAPDMLEAMAFAYLAYAYDAGLPGNIPAVTGASQSVVLGVCFTP
jgi:anhydro-N-acetylmuramic acid kinase